MGRLDLLARLGPLTDADTTKKNGRVPMQCGCSYDRHGYPQYQLYD
ncbi:MAG: hypothetical protein ACN4GW_14375 [Desulforhopalus sp.]